MRFGSLFSGIGGLDLGLERAGMACRWQVEVDEWCRAVLAQHWPPVPQYSDIRELDPLKLLPVDVIAGGFPCTDVSNAGRRIDGIYGKHSGLWSEFARFIRVLRPRYVLVENVPGLAARGLDRVLGDLAALGFDAEWDCVGAGHLGAPHLRRRIVLWAAFRPVPDAFSDVVRVFRQRVWEQRRITWPSVSGDHGATLADADGFRSQTRAHRCGTGNETSSGFGESDRRRRDGARALADGDRGRCEEQRPTRTGGPSRAESHRRGLPRWPPPPADLHAWRRVPTTAQPAICLLADGDALGLVRQRPGRRGRLAGARRRALKALGNAVVPAWAEAAGRALIEVTA